MKHSKGYVDNYGRDNVAHIPIQFQYKTKVVRKRGLPSTYIRSGNELLWGKHFEVPQYNHKFTEDKHEVFIFQKRKESNQDPS